MGLFAISRWILLLHVVSGGEGFSYPRSSSSSRETNGCRPRLKPRVFKRFCQHITNCENDKDCRRSNEQCICDDNCGKRCYDTSACTDDGTCGQGKCVENKCICNAGFTGPQCSQDIDECKKIPNLCKNGASCSNNHGGYICNCIAAFTGKNCSINIDDCAIPAGKAPICKNGGICNDMVGKYNCTCPKNYTGLHCEHEIECETIKPCHPNNTEKCMQEFDGKAKCSCKKGFKGENCTVDIDECKENEHSCSQQSTRCENTIGSYICHCKVGYQGKNCDQTVNKCKESPCLNGGTCSTELKDSKVFAKCFCLNGFSGKTCEIEENSCDSSPCKHGAQCVKEPDGYKCKCTKGHDGKNCEIVCPIGFTGKGCLINIDDCSSMSVQCKNNGTCVDGINNYTCVCLPGFNGFLCEHDINECEYSPCGNNGNCTNSHGSYHCTCSKGYTGINCAENINECAQVRCLNDGKCRDELNNYTCICHPGFTGRNCEINVDECRTLPCQNGGTCVDGIASYLCLCPKGKTGQNCDVSIDKCLNHQCKNGAKCKSFTNTYKCICKPGYIGQYCDVDINDCNPSPCKRGACVDLVNDYSCKCPHGYTGKNCDVDIDYCKDEVCFNNGTCVDKLDSFYCACANGFNGKYCQDMTDQCLSHPCQNGATCVNEIGNYSCYCKFGYEGRNCDRKIDWCSASRNPCKNGAKCLLEEPGSVDFNCKCAANYTGKICDLRHQTCAIASKGGKPACQNGGTCVDRVSYYTCSCRPGFTGSYCEININDCASGPCINGATCIDGIDSYTCKCLPGFTGTNCERNINECSPSPCHHGVCYDLINQFYCKCPRGYTGRLCQNNPDDCGPGACLNRGNCTDGVGDFRCTCASGYKGKRCEEDINECLSNPCSAAGTEVCVNLVNDYECKCKRGFTKRDCSFNINECLSTPCQNGGTCLDQTGKFACFCPYGFGGNQCERRIKSCVDNPCRNEGVCQAHDSGYTCRCKPGVEGYHCEVNKDDCLSSPCKNGGRCVDGYNDFSCHCEPGYSGKTCENVIECNNIACSNGGELKSINAKCRCSCPAGYTGISCEVKKKCPYDECSNSFSLNADCGGRCNSPECDFAGKSCSLNIDPWKDCPYANYCFPLFDNGKCDLKCDMAKCMFDAFDCRPKLPACSNITRCAKSMGDGVCDEQCNTKSCGFDAFDCDESEPKMIPGVVKLWLRMDIIVFQEQKNYFLLNMSRIVKAVVTIEKKLGVEQYQAVVFGRRRRSTYAKRYKRDSEDSRGTQVNLKVDNRKCESNCFSSTGQVANYLAALKTKNEKLPGDPYKIEAESPPAGGGPSPPIQPLYIAIICVSLPLIAVGVLVGGKRVFAKLWLPEGFPSRSIKRHSQRHDPVGEDSDDKGSIGKTSTCEEEYPDQPTHSGRSRKRLKLVVDDGPLRIANPKDNRQWTALHREVADVNNRTISSLSVLTPPQEGQECSAAQSDVNAIGPGGMTPLMLAVSRGTYLDGGPLEDDKDSDDNGGQVVGELIQFGARIESISDESKETALHLAARHARADAAKRLLDAGADSNAKDRTGRTPLHLAVTADAQGVFQLLIRHRATLLDEPSDDGTTPLIYAARFMVDEMVEDLIKAGAKVNLTDKQGKTALHWAASVDNEKATALLLRNNAKRDAQDAKGQTPLFLASKEGSASVVKLLLSSFANRKLADNMDQSPLDIAKQRDHADIVKLLSDWSLGCKSPSAAPAPTSPAGEMSPLAARTLSPPDVRPKTNRSPRTQLSTETQQKQSRKKRRKSRPENEGPIAVALVSRNSPPSVAGVNGTSPRQGLSPFNSSNSYGSSLSPSNSTFSPPLHHIDGMPSPLRDSDLVNGIPDTGFYPMTEEMACYQNSLNPDAEFMNVENAVDLNELSMLFGASSEQQNNKDCMYGGQYPPDNMILPNGVENEVQVRLRYGTDRRAHGMPAKTCVRSPSQLTAWNSLCSNVVPSVATIDGIHRRRARNQDCQYPSPPYELSPTSPHENQWSSSSSSRASNSDCSTC